MEGMEDLISFHQFVQASSKKTDPFMLQKRKLVESEILSCAFNFVSTNLPHEEDFTLTSNDGKSKKKKELIKKTMAIANQIINKNEEGEMNFMNI